jgi:hypothetical protein
MAKQYQNEGIVQRREERRALREQGLQNTQRSWSNYVGDKPIERWIGKQPISAAAMFYGDSPKYGPNAKSRIPSGDAFTSGAAAAQQDATAQQTSYSPLMGYAGSPFSFTEFGRTTVGGPQEINQPKTMMSPFDIENIRGTTTSEFGGLQLFRSYSQPSAPTGVSFPPVSFPQIPSTGSSMPPNWQLPTQRPFNFNLY